MRDSSSHALGGQPPEEPRTATRRTEDSHQKNRGHQKHSSGRLAQRYRARSQQRRSSDDSTSDYGNCLTALLGQVFIITGLKPESSRPSTRVYRHMMQTNGVRPWRKSYNGKVRGAKPGQAYRHGTDGDRRGHKKQPKPVNQKHRG